MRTDPRAVGLKRSTHAVVASASENTIDQKTSWVQAKPSRFRPKHWENTPGRNNRPRLTASRIAKLSEDGPRFQPKLLRTGRYMPRLFIWKTQRLRSKPGPFFRNIPDISIVALQIFREMLSSKYPEYFEENGGWLRFLDRFPEISGIFREIGPYKKISHYVFRTYAGVTRTDLGKRSVGNMKRLHFPGAIQTNFPKYSGFFGNTVRENTHKCNEQVSRFRFIK